MSKKNIISGLKIFISIGLLYFVLKKIPFREIIDLWQSVTILWVVAGAFFFLFSQILSAKRLEIFLHQKGFLLSFKSNLKLYAVGMFYNFFIPGGIGGDAYKIYLLNQNFSWSVKQLTQLIFTDRLSGLIAIGVLIGGGFVFIIPDFKLISLIFLLSIIYIIYRIIKKWFKNWGNIFWKTLLYSIGVQALQVVSFIFLLKSIGVTTDFLHYGLLFLLSSVLSLVSFAGIGVREILFLQASKFFDFTPSYSVSASLLFTVITAFFSLLGLIFQIKKLHLKIK